MALLCYQGKFKKLVRVTALQHPKQFHVVVTKPGICLEFYKFICVFLCSIQTKMKKLGCIV